MSATLEYSLSDSDYRFAFPASQKTYGRNWWLIADELAGDYFDNHDGWESQWPQTLRIFEDGQEVAAFTIEMEMEPTFRAYDLEQDQ